MNNIWRFICKEVRLTSWNEVKEPFTETYRVALVVCPDDLFIKPVKRWLTVLQQHAWPPCSPSNYHRGKLNILVCNLSPVPTLFCIPISGGKLTLRFLGNVVHLVKIDARKRKRGWSHGAEPGAQQD